MSDKPDQSGQLPATKMPRMILSRELLGGDKVVIIRHEQDDYRLQVTAAGKLILTK
ncbi:MAG: hemin uptake protein HemP [Xanthobacteraceae bacterium]